MEDRRPRHGEIGHNGPPLDDDGNALPVDFVNVIKEASRTIVEETEKSAPDALVVAQAASRLQAIMGWLKPRANLAADELAKKLGSSAGVAVVAVVSIACAALATPLHNTLSASAHWFAAILAAS